MILFDDKSLQTSDDARRELGKKYIQLIERAKNASGLPGVDIAKRVKDGSDYLHLRQDIKGSKFYGSEFRDGTVRNNIITFLALLTANSPKYSFMPVEPYDVSLVDIYRKRDDWQWNLMRMHLKYHLSANNMLTHGTGAIVLFHNKVTGELDSAIPSIAELLVDDWTQWDVDRHRRIYRLLIDPIDQVLKDNPHLAGKIDPTDDNQYTQYMQAMIPNWGQLSGTSNPLSFPREKMKAEWAAGNVIGWEIYEKMGSEKVKRSTIYNSNLASSIKTDWDKIPIVLLRNHLTPDSVLGTSEAEVCMHVSDAITEAVHSMLHHKALFSKGVWYSNKNCGKAPQQLQAYLDRPGHIFEVDDRTFDRGAIKMIQPSPLNQADTQTVPFMQGMANTLSGNSQWLQGSVAPGEDPAQKVAYLQQAGLSRIKMQAKIMDKDALFRLGHLFLEYYQRDKKERTIRIVGEYDAPSNNPRFIDLNMELTKQTLETLIDVAQRSGQAEKVPGYQTRMTADELMAQKEMIEKRANLEGVVPMYKLNDMSIAKFDISVEDSDALPFNDAQKRQVLAMLAEMKIASPKEVRKIYGFPIDPKSMSEIAATVPIIPVEQLAQQLEQTMENPEEHMQVMQQLLQYIQQLQTVVAQ